MQKKFKDVFHIIRDFNFGAKLSVIHIFRTGVSLDSQ